MIVIGGMIGLGKTTTARFLSERLSLPVYFESVEGNPVLPLFYESREEERLRKRYPFLLQLTFLAKRAKSIRSAARDGRAVLDRSIHEDRYFALSNHRLGNISDLEMSVYDGLFEETYADLRGLPSLENTVYVYLKGSFDTVLRRIRERGRSFELGESLVSYYRFLWEGYDEYVLNAFRDEPILVLDVDRIDLQENPREQDFLLARVKELLEGGKAN